MPRFDSHTPHAYVRVVGVFVCGVCSLPAGHAVHGQAAMLSGLSQLMQDCMKRLDALEALTRA